MQKGTTIGASRRTEKGVTAGGITTGRHALDLAISI
jgi:hypothetical protein